MRPTCLVLIIVALLPLWAPIGVAENIDPYDDGSQYGYGENIGWVNFEPNQGPGVTVTDERLTGFVWAENIGWINLDPDDTAPDSGVENDGTGQLSGFTWGENVGWINFKPKVSDDSNHYGVTIDHDGNFEGWAWGENIGWIHFQSATPVAYKVQTSWITSCIVDWDDLDRFCDVWLDTGGGLPGDLDDSGDVNFKDYCTVADLWLELCPVGWPLK